MIQPCVCWSVPVTILPIALRAFALTVGLGCSNNSTSLRTTPLCTTTSICEFSPSLRLATARHASASVAASWLNNCLLNAGSAIDTCNLNTLKSITNEWREEWEGGRGGKYGTIDPLLWEGIPLKKNRSKFQFTLQTSCLRQNVQSYWFVQPTTFTSKNRRKLLIPTNKRRLYAGIWGPILNFNKRCNLYETSSTHRILIDPETWENKWIINPLLAKRPIDKSK